MPDKARLLADVRRLVVKVGSNVLAGDAGLRPTRVRNLAADVAALVGAGRQVVLVSSGAVAAGKLDLAETRARLPGVRAAFAARGIALQAVSGATGEGTRELMHAVADLVRAERASRVSEPLEAPA